MTDWVDVGILLRAHGVRGAARLRLDPDTPFQEGSSFQLRPRGPGQAPRTTRAIAPRAAGADWLTQLEGFDSPESLRPWHGARVLWPRAALPAAAPGEYYFWELLGVAVRDAAGAPLGRVSHFSDNGAQPLLAIRDAGGRIRLIPALPAFMRRFDRAAGELILALPDDLWADA